MSQIIQCNLTTHPHQLAFIDLLNHYISDDMGGGETLNRSRAEELFVQLNNQPNFRAFFVLYEGEVAGMITTFKNISTFQARPLINIHDVIVKKSCRNKGLGHKLVGYVLALARNENCCRVNLEVREDNHRAMEVYRDFDFGSSNPKMLFWERILDDSEEGIKSTAAEKDLSSE
ncbi:GNAT family N-acetyltransferase [Prolixibacter sp. SD074]|uniref:GNAT family N-acetyltransferase n=1 Tax=Prolixibacter sp. SD074 TaxID=2652391 RepID=UPI0012753755|nr:GNAT family N-acetyltransferase [Prolixibacter sp. SD074]GET27901.1 N-acetyltransferase [Prolixibacter sp. SD074]